MSILSKEFTGDFYDEQYYSNGKKSGKGWLENYHWMPRRSMKEAFAFIDNLKLDETSKVLDFGCAYGFIVKAMRILEIPTSGCDISDYALTQCPDGCFNLNDENSWNILREAEFTHIICKDVLEHMTKDQLHETLKKLSEIAPVLMVVVPMGDKGKYRIPEYHLEISHLIAEDEEWWMNAFKNSGWTNKKCFNHVTGLKDNWQYSENGNAVFILGRSI
jgi:hypothetical protein